MGKTRICTGEMMTVLTHHETLDVLHPCILDRLAHQDHTDGCPNQEEYTEGSWNKPVQWRQMYRASEYDMQWWCVHNEHSETCTC
jgi:hypothetical protein